MNQTSNPDLDFVIERLELILNRYKDDNETALRTIKDLVAMWKGYAR